MKGFYLLHLKDAEDGYLYASFLFGNKKEFERAKSVIHDFDYEWKENPESHSEDDNYFDLIMEKLSKENIKALDFIEETVKIR